MHQARNLDIVTPSQDELQQESLMKGVQHEPLREGEFQQKPLMAEFQHNQEPGTEDEFVDSEYIFMSRRRTKRHTINRRHVITELPDRGSESGSESPTGETSDYTSGIEIHDEAVTDIFEDYSLPSY